ncbi:MAG: DNA repair protein RadA [Gemmatimonadota bacterium]|nr:DNA repair protein RadA [Gemmatimonadota bacterium]
MRATRRFVCGDCGRETLRWEGRCPGCDAWNSLEEVAAPPPGGRFRRHNGVSPRPLSAGAGEDTSRRSIVLGDIDRVLGGGLVPGSIVLLGGAPGVGKSTLLLQIAGRVVSSGGSVLYASGEESEDQVRRRALRLAGGAAEVLFMAETSVGAILEAARTSAPDLLCVDSIQTTVSDGGSSAPGSVTQVRDAADELRVFAKESGTPTVIVGHVTKGGGIAGPRTLEHMVDVVMQFEGGETTRLLRTTKNRFGRVGELALFRMAGGGLEPVTDPESASVRGRVAAPGSAVAATIEGARPVLLEVQALTTRSAQSVPRRMTTGFSPRRLAMLLAVLDRRGGVPLDRSEVFVNVVGGFRITDPAADAAVLAALASAELDRVLPTGCAFVGETGLSGELRGVRNLDGRLRELARAGVSDVVLPAASEGPEDPADERADLTLHFVATARDLVGWILSNAEPATGGE